MSYLTYTDDIQKNIIKCKRNGMKVVDICNEFNISIYSLYKILYMNGEMPIPSKALEGKGSEECVEHRSLSPNNNNSHEYPISTWNFNSDRHKKINHICRKHNIKLLRFRYDEDINEKSMLIKIYAKLQKNESVEVRDKKLLR